MWPFGKGQSFEAAVNENVERILADMKPNPGRELANMRNPDKRRSYKAFHDAMRLAQGKPPIVWAD